MLFLGRYHPLNNPDGSKNGGVGIFYKESLPLRIREDLSFDACLVSELKFGHKKCSLQSSIEILNMMRPR